MSGNPEKILITLRDIAGVEGSWFLDGQNAVAARDLSTLYPDDIISNLGTRFRQISDAAAEHLPGREEDLILRFETRALFVRRAGSCLLAVMTLPNVNYQSLRIGVHLVLRQLMAAPAATPPAAVSPATAASARPAPASIIPQAMPPSRAIPAAPRPAAAPKKSSGIWGD